MISLENIKEYMGLHDKSQDQEIMNIRDKIIVLAKNYMNNPIVDTWETGKLPGLVNLALLACFAFNYERRGETDVVVLSETAKSLLKFYSIDKMEELENKSDAKMALIALTYSVGIILGILTLIFEGSL